MKIAIIGAGNMGGAMALGLAQSGLVQAADICVSNPTESKLKALQDKQPELHTTTDNVVCAKDADIVIIAVKPWKVEEVALELQAAVKKGKQAVASVAAGITLSQMEQWFEGSAIFTIIPNTAIAQAQSMTFMASRHSNTVLDTQVLELFKALGDAMLVEERLMEAGMALASCGIAYALRYVRAATEGGVQLGFRAAEAQRIVAQTLRGAATLLEEGAHAEAEIDRVTTPGGRTIKGLNAMEQAGFTNAVVQGLLASVNK